MTKDNFYFGEFTLLRKNYRELRCQDFENKFLNLFS